MRIQLICFMVIPGETAMLLLEFRWVIMAQLEAAMPAATIRLIECRWSPVVQ
jgi:hypothetical protein